MKNRNQLRNRISIENSHGDVESPSHRIDKYGRRGKDGECAAKSKQTRDSNEVGTFVNIAQILPRLHAWKVKKKKLGEKKKKYNSLLTNQISLILIILTDIHIDIGYRSLGIPARCTEYHRHRPPQHHASTWTSM